MNTIQIYSNRVYFCTGMVCKRLEQESSLRIGSNLSAEGGNNGIQLLIVHSSAESAGANDST